jgi:hypothetical protein
MVHVPSCKRRKKNPPLLVADPMTTQEAALEQDTELKNPAVAPG